MLKIVRCCAKIVIEENRENEPRVFAVRDFAASMSREERKGILNIEPR